jgi:hypothetical protein
MKRLVTQEEEIEAIVADSAARDKLAQIDEELTLYHPSGAWSFLKGRLETMKTMQLSLLENGPIEEVTVARAKLSIIRHLLALPEELQGERARLQEQMNEHL